MSDQPSPEVMRSLHAIFCTDEPCQHGKEDLSRDPAEEACYEIQKALWEFQTAIERCESAGRLAFIDGMLAESRKRLDLVIIAVGAKQAELDAAKEPR